MIQPPLRSLPLAGLLAFVDVGDAKAAQCGPVLSAASAAAQPSAGSGGAAPSPSTSR